MCLDLGCLLVLFESFVYVICCLLFGWLVLSVDCRVRVAPLCGLAVLLPLLRCLVCVACVGCFVWFVCRCYA